MSQSDGYMPFGGWEDDKGEINNAPEILSAFPKFMKGYFHEDGLVLVHEYGGYDGYFHSFMLILSPTTDFWVRAMDTKNPEDDNLEPYTL